MYMGRSDDCEAMVHFRNGFVTALSVTELLPASFSATLPGFELQYYMKRRWNEGMFTPLKVMRRKGLSDEHILLELIKIEVNTWKEYRSLLVGRPEE